MQNTNQFLVSVCDVVLRDVIADQVVLKGKTLINSAFNQTLASQEIRGGAQNALLFLYQHDKKLDITIEDARFDETYLAISNGTSIVNSAQNLYNMDEPVTLVSGSGTLLNTPVGNIYVQKADNTIVTLTPTGKNFTVPGGANTTVKVTYRSSSTVDTITIDASSVPNAYELTMTASIFQGTGKTANLQIVVPQFRISGNFQLSFTANGVSTNKIDGMALVNTSDNSLARVMIAPVGASSIAYSAIAATPDSVSLSSTNSTQQLTVYGIRSGLASSVVVTSDCTFATSDATKATVSASGLVTRVAAGGPVYVTVTHTPSGLTDTVSVTLT